MDKNKEKCRRLKEIRKQMAEKLTIDLQQTECTYEGKCSGTCPKCRQEEEKLNKALLGKAAVILGLGLSLTACTSIPDGDVDELSGDVVLTTEEAIVEESSEESEWMELEGDVIVSE